jgi:hypothetical protein
MANDPRARHGVRDTVPFIVLACLAAFCVGGPLFTNDAFWHVSTGGWIAAHGFGGPDPFSFTAADKEWIQHEWLTQILFWAVHQAGGFGALRALTAAMAVLILWLVFRLFRGELGHPAWGLLGVMLFCATGAARLQTRPTLFTIAATLLLCTWLVDRRDRWRPRDGIRVVLLVGAWVNLHSVGLLALPIYGAWLCGTALAAIGDRASRRDLVRHAATFTACVAATLATPAGVRLYAFALQDKRDVMQYVTDEWGPFHLQWSRNESLSPECYVAMLGVLGLLGVTYGAAAIALHRAAPGARRALAPDPRRAMLLMAFLALALAARRFHWMAALVALLSLDYLRQFGPALLGRGWRPRWPWAARATAVAALMIAVAAILSRAVPVDGRPLPEAVRHLADYARPVQRSFDLAGVRFLRDAGLRGNAFCHYGSGGILAAHLFPQIKVFIDSRIDLYGRDVYLDYVAVRDGHPRQLEILDGHGCDMYYRHWDLAPPRDATAWICVYRDVECDVWLRDHARNGANLDRVARYWNVRESAFDPSAGLPTPHR